MAVAPPLGEADAAAVDVGAAVETAAGVDARDVFVGRYRHGQRAVLDDAIRVLEAACSIPLAARRRGTKRWRLRRAQARRRIRPGR